MMMTTEHIWNTFHTQLKGFILKRVPNQDEAEDILQDVFLKIHTHLHTVRDEDKLVGWMYQIVRNAIYDSFREQRPLVKDVSDSYDEYALAEDIPEESVIAELLPCLTEMVNRLPADYRQAIVLTEYEGLSQKQLSERLDISYSGAKSRVQRAREKLKTMLLNCCYFQFDRLGNVIDYQPRCCPPEPTSVICC